MSTKPIVHVHYINDDYKDRKGAPCFDKYLQVTPGRIFNSYGGFDSLDVLSVSKDNMVLRLDKETATLRPGETVTMRYELPGLIADGSGFEYFTATIRWLTAEQAENVIAEPMNDRYLVMEWDYKYDKENTWFDEDSGKEHYRLRKGVSYPLPHMKEKSLEIRSVTAEGDRIVAELYVDHEIYTVYSGSAAVVGYAHDDYTVSGDFVSKTLCLRFIIC